MAGLIGRLLGGLLGRGGADLANLPSLSVQGDAIWAVGDVHGCRALYRQLEAAILEREGDAGAVIVQLGDLVDRGRDSAGVIDHLMARPPKGLTRHILRGNHEAMMMAFHQAPHKHLKWLDFGGAETLASYGMTMDSAIAAKLHERRLRQMLDAHIPEQHFEFLRGLGAGLVWGRYLLAHASADPGFPAGQQPIETLLWGAPPEAAPAGVVVVHGHTITAEPRLTDADIGIDTGAYHTGRLTAVRLTQHSPPVFLTVSTAETNKSARKGS